MNIRRLRATPVNIPLRAPYRFSYGSIASLTKTVVELETDEGVIGLGECADGDRAAEVLALNDRLVGQDLRDLNGAAARCVPAMDYTPWGNVLAARRAFAGVEMAMWDARGKTEGLPLCTLLGGAVRREIPLTEYFSYRLPGTNEPGEASPAQVAAFCARMIEQHDARAFEGKVGTVDLAEEIAMIREVRDAIGDRLLSLDANGVWTLPAARIALLRFLPYGIDWIEEPCARYEEMAALRQHMPVNISAHLIDLPKAVRLGCPDAIVTNINELGGIAGTRDFVAACAAFDVGFRFHSGETGVASAAYLQLSAALEHVRGASQTLLRWYADDVIEGGPMQPKSGVLPVPEGPGLGVTLDRAALARCHGRYLEEGAFPSAGPGGYGAAFRRR
ncbi:MAG: mandelate racemase/muconate lactonizing enzyme family protein [Pseudomonadota bacterium]